MLHPKLSWLKSILPHAKFGPDLPEEFSGISIDSRTITSGELFIAIQGDNFDGHDFIEAALEKGAVGIVGSTAPSSDRAVLVEDTLAALHTIAREHLKSLPCIKAALTGSAGKTTTKEMVRTILEAEFGVDKIFVSAGNFNNHIGVPLQAFNVTELHQIALFEMGMNHLGEIKTLCGIVHPTIALITNIGTAHRGNFNSLEEIAEAKGEIFASLGINDVAIVNSHDSKCIEQANQSRAKMIAFNDHDCPADMPLLGRHNRRNAAAALALAWALGADKKKAEASLSKAKAVQGRLSKSIQNGITIIDDTYNANPESMRAAIKTLMDIDGSRHIAVLGEMLELGNKAADIHQKLGSFCAKSKVDMLLACGAYADSVLEGAVKGGMDPHAINIALDSEALAPTVKERIQSGDVVLFKGSRGARMELSIPR